MLLENKFQHKDLAIATELELGRRLAIGGVGHITLFTVVFFATPFLNEHPTFILTIGTALIVTNVLRFWLSRKQQDFYPHNRAKWMWSFDILLVFTACLWGLLCLSSIHYYGLTSATTSILLLVTSGICAGGATSLNPSALRAQSFIGITLAIPILRIVTTDHPQSMAFATIFVIYGAFLFLQIRGQSIIFLDLLKTMEDLSRSKDLAHSAYQGLEKAEQIGKFGSWEYELKKQKFRGSKGLYKLLQIPDDVTLSYDSFIAKVEESDRKIFEPAMEESIVTRQPFSCSFRMRANDDSILWLNNEGHPIYDELGNFNKLVGTVHNITEKIESDQALLAATLAAESASKAKTRFLANMSHEIRTPMNGIIGMTNLLLGTVSDSAQTEKLKIIQTCGNNLLDLINDILDFSKIEVDKIELEIEPFAPHNTVKEVIELLNIKAYEKGIILSYSPTLDGPPWILGDDTRFRQVITNLLSNAIKFTEKGSISVFSKAKQLPDDCYEFQFEVKDTGLGIPDKVKSKLFQSFSQVDASTTRKFGGTGLGLAISKGLCEKMGGTIWVESKVGEGSTFIFTFKAKRTEAIITNKSANPFAVADSDLGKKNPLHILIAEDNRVNQMVLAGLLGKLGYQADVATNGIEVLETLSLKPYDIIFMDCHMPLLDGFETAKKITEQYAKEKRPKIIATTASTMKEDIDRCYDCGMEGFISKPITVQNLLNVLSECQQFLISNDLNPKSLNTEAPPQISEAASPFDHTTFMSNFYGIEDIARDAILSFLDTLPKMVSAIELAISTKNASALEIAAHTLKGAASNFYAEPTVLLAWQLEQTGHGSSIAGAEQIFSTLKVELNKLQEALRKVASERKVA